jgi:hypothetical protein
MRAALSRLGRARNTESRSRPAPTTARRHRFAQDGDVVVEYAARQAGSAPVPDETALNDLREQLETERRAHAVTERELADARHQLQLLQTRLGHLELTLSEAQRPAPAPEPAAPSPPLAAAANAPVPRRPKRQTAPRVVSEKKQKPVKWWL